MNSRKKTIPMNQAPDARLNHCLWMQAGVVDYKLCDREFDCEHCAFDEVLNGRVRNLPAIALKSNLEPNKSESKHSVKSPGREPTQIANDLFFHSGHTWARVEEGGTVRTGIDQMGQQVLGRAYAVTLPSVQTNLLRGKAAWRFIHQAGVTSLVSPVSGTVKEINTNLLQRPSLINHDPYGTGWTILIEPTDLKNCLTQLFYAQTAKTWSQEQLQELTWKLAQIKNGTCGALGATMTDGGVLKPDFMNGLTTEQRHQVIKSIFSSSPEEESERNNSILVQDRR